MNHWSETDPATGIRVDVAVDQLHDRLLYKSSTDSGSQAIPDEFAPFCSTQSVALVARELLRSFSQLRPYEASKSILMR